MVKLRRITLSDGTSKLEVVPETVEEIEYRRNLHSEHIRRRNERKKQLSNMTIEEKLEEYEKRFIETFWNNVDIREKEICWIYKGTVGWKGYGQVYYKRKYEKAHRIAYILTYGEIPKDKPHIRHTCDNPLCCNPNHLISGTNQDNINDKMVRKRSIIGEKHPNHKLLAKEVKELRDKYRSGMDTITISKLYNISREEVYFILRNERWKDDTYTIPIGRHGNAGDNCHFAKLTWKEVSEIRRKHSESRYTYKKLSEEYNVSTKTIQFIINKKTWNSINCNSNDIQ